MMSFKFRYVKLGGHVHVGVWTSEYGPETTHGCNGRLTFREEEWVAFRTILALTSLANVKFIEEPTLGITEPEA